MVRTSFAGELGRSGTDGTASGTSQPAGNLQPRPRADGGVDVGADAVRQHQRRTGQVARRSPFSIPNIEIVA